jgi:hypothetical protein
LKNKPKQKGWQHGSSGRVIASKLKALSLNPVLPKKEKKRMTVAVHLGQL